MSAYFVDNVTTYIAASKTKRGALLQKVAKGFEHFLLVDGLAVERLVETLRDLVEVVNANTKGRRFPLILIYDQWTNCIDVHTAGTSGDNTVFMMSLKKVADGALDSSVIRSLAVRLADDSAIMEEMHRIATVKKGGAR